MGLVQFTWQSYYDALIFDLLQIISAKNKTLLLSICAKTIVLSLPSQKLWQIIASLCLKGTKACVGYYYSQGLHKHALSHTQAEVTGRHKKAHIASVIISRGNHNSVHTTEECKNKRAIQQQ